MKTTVVDNRLVEALLANPQVRTDFPSLVAASKAKSQESTTSSKCPTRRCGGTPRASGTRFDHMAVKRALALLSTSQLDAIKKIVKTDRLRIQYVSQVGETNLVL